MAVGPRWVFVALKQLPQQHPAAAFDGVDVHLILHLDDVAVFFQQEPQMRIVQPAFTAEALEGDLREIAAEEIRRPLQATFQPVRCVARAAGNVGAKKDIPLLQYKLPVCLAQGRALVCQEACRGDGTAGYRIFVLPVADLDSGGIVNAVDAVQLAVPAEGQGLCVKGQDLLRLPMAEYPDVFIQPVGNEIKPVQEEDAAGVEVHIPGKILHGAVSRGVQLFKLFFHGDKGNVPIEPGGNAQVLQPRHAGLYAAKQQQEGIEVPVAHTAGRHGPVVQIATVAGGAHIFHQKSCKESQNRIGVNFFQSPVHPLQLGQPQTEALCAVIQK